MTEFSTEKKYKTREGRPVRFLGRIEAPSSPLVFVMTHPDGKESVFQQTEKTDYVIPVVEKTSVFRNIYQSKAVLGVSFNSLSQARAIADTRDWVGTLEFQYEDGKYVSTVLHPAPNEGDKK